MARKKTPEEFELEVHNIVGEEYTLLTRYVNSTTKVKIRHNCKSCNNREYEITPKAFLNGKRCNVCSHRKSNEEFQKQLKSLVGDEYSAIDNYVSNKTDMTFRHNKCGNEWVATPNMFLTGCRCPKCQHRSYLKNTDEFKKEVYELVGNEYEVLEKYTNAKTKILLKHKCIKCNNHEFKMSPNTFLNGQRCPQCKTSKGEDRIENTSLTKVS